MNRDRLKGAIFSASLTMETFATSMHMDRATLWRKMTGISDFTREEILNARKILNLSVEDTEKIFFSE